MALRVPRHNVLVSCEMRLLHGLLDSGNAFLGHFSDFPGVVFMP